MNFFKKDVQFNMIFFNKNLGKFQRCAAFTLAEVLITLTIIGVIAAITLPLLMKNTQNKENIALLKQAHSLIKQAEMSVKANDNVVSPPETASISDIYNYFNAFIKYLKVAKYCTDGSCYINPADCKSVGFPYFCTYGINWYAQPRVQLQNGMYIAFVVTSFSYPNTVAYLYVDVNGTKGPNTEAIDQFIFQYDLSKQTYIPVDALYTNTATTLLTK